MALLFSRMVIVTDKNVNRHQKSYVNTSINKTIQFPHFHWGITSAGEFYGPGFVFIGTKPWYASGSNNTAGIECCSPETWAPRSSCKVQAALLSSTMCKEVQVQHPWRKSNQNELVWFIWILLTLTEHVSRHIFIVSLSKLGNSSYWN